jgi:hypothetical protein
MKTVIYQGKLYNVIHKYESGYYEIREVEEEYASIILVNSTDLEEVKTDKKRSSN